MLTWIMDSLLVQLLLQTKNKSIIGLVSDHAFHVKMDRVGRAVSHKNNQLLRALINFYKRDDVLMPLRCPEIGSILNFVLLASWVKFTTMAISGRTSQRNQNIISLVKVALVGKRQPRLSSTGSQQASTVFHCQHYSYSPPFLCVPLYPMT